MAHVQQPEPSRARRTPRWVVVVVSVAAAAWLIAATGGAQSAPAEGEHPPPPWPVSDPPSSGDPAVDAAARFLVHAGPAGSPDLALILDHLDRRYGLPWASEVVARARWEAARAGSEQASLFARAYDPDATVPAPPEDMTSQPTDQLTSTALHCDRWPLPDDYAARLEDQATRRGLGDKNHALIPLIWAHEHGCMGDAEYERSRDRLAPQVAQAVQQRPSVDDPFVEAVALLTFVGRSDLVDPAWISAIRAAQQPDGGWKEEADSRGSSSHTTFLALWVLLQQDHPDEALTSWIRDP